MTHRYPVYDRRIAKDVDSNGDGTVDAGEQYAYDGGHVLIRAGRTGAVTNRYLHGPQVDQVFADESTTDGLLWALADQQGTVRDWVDHHPLTDTTTVADHLKFDGFGKITAQSSATHKPLFAYTGREWDADAGLYYYRARWYDPAAGEFLSEDPIGFAARDTNLSRYVGNAPTNFTDPSGLDPRIYEGDLDGGHMTVAPVVPTPLAPLAIPPDVDKWPLGTQGDIAALIGYFVTPPSRPEMYSGIPILTPPLLPRAPSGAASYVSGGEAGVVTLKPGQYFGVDGAGPCAGCILIPKPEFRGDDYRTIAFHFHANNNPGPTLLHMGVPDFPWYAYGAVLNGCQIQDDPLAEQMARTTMARLVNGLTSRNVPILGYVPGAGVYVGHDGTIYMPQTNSPEGYDPDLLTVPQ